MKKVPVCAVRVGVLALAILVLVAPQVPAPVDAAPRPVKVLTRNLYVGADLTRLFTATTVPELLERAKLLFEMIQATDFPARAKVLVSEIKEADPSLVALQEVSLVRKGPLDGPASQATTVVYDYLQILQAELAAQDLQYTVAVEQFTTDGEVPSALGFDIRLTQRNVILRKANLPADELSVSNADSDIFDTNLSFTVAGIPGVDKRGWTSVDATVSGRTLRLINTHLDSTSPIVRAAQASELLAGPANTSLPVLLIGDLNSAPTEGSTAAYGILVGAGFKDTWTQANPSSPGQTCCYAENLLNPSPTLTRRIDHILTRPTVAVERSRLVGTDPDNRTPAGLWPSDHAGIIATLAP